MKYEFVPVIHKESVCIIVTLKALIRTVKMCCENPGTKAVDSLYYIYADV
jgi:hypothetical protein